MKLLMFLMTAMVLTGQPPSAAARVKRAQELTAAGKLEEAHRIYEELIRETPGSGILLLNLSVVEYRAGAYTDVERHAREALLLEPRLIAARQFLGAAQLELGEYDRAAEELARVVVANPRDRNAQLFLGESLLLLGNAAKAIEHLRATAQPTNPRGWYLLGRAYELQGDNPKAQEVWSMLQALTPGSHLLATQIQNKQGRDAVREWRASVERAPQSRTARLGLAWLLHRRGDYDGAAAALKPLLETPSAEAQFLSGGGLLNRHQSEAALPYLRKALELDGRLLLARLALGQALLQTCKPHDAIPFLQAAASADTDGTVHFQLFRAYQLTHQDAEALAALAAAQRLRDSVTAPR